MRSRDDLQAILEEILGSGNVYFQPPTNVQMAYPAIVYQRDAARTEFANNLPYKYTQRYQVTHISPDVDSVTPAKIAKLPLTSFERFFVAENLNHDVFIIYF